MIRCCCGFEGGSPGVRDAGCQRRRAVGGGDVLADRVPLVAVHPALTLLEIDGVAGQVPMHDGMAPPVEIDPLLPDGSRRQHERPERRVERRPDLGQPGFLVAALRAAEPQGVPAGERDAPGRRSDRCRWRGTPTPSGRWRAARSVQAKSAPHRWSCWTRSLRQGGECTRREQPGGRPQCSTAPLSASTRRRPPRLGATHRRCRPGAAPPRAGRTGCANRMRGWRRPANGPARLPGHPPVSIGSAPATRCCRERPGPAVRWSPAGRPGVPCPASSRPGR